MKYDIEKDVDFSFRAIEYLHNETALKTSLINFPINDCLATSKKTDVGFTIKFLIDKLDGIPFLKDLDDCGVKENVLFTNDNRTYSINKNSVARITRTISNPSLLTIETTNFQNCLNADFDNEMIRLIVPCKEEPEFDVFHCKSLHISGTTTFQGLIEVSVKGKYYQIFKHKNEDTNRKYLIIDSLEKNDFDEFKNNTNALILAFGFVTGNLHFGEYYYHTDNRTKPNNIGDFVAYYKKTESIITNASIFSPSDFHDYLKFLKQEDLLKKIDLYLSRESFSKITEQIARNETFARCITLIIQGNHNNNLLLRSGIYSIALETLTNIIYEENQEKINPIQDKKLATTIQEKFKEIVKEYDAFLTEYGIAIINSKINDLNKPTNSKKLTKPFELYGIQLSKKDIEILNHRNKFLHGSSPFDESKLIEKEKELKYISSRLLSLIVILALKYCNYRGHVSDFGSLHQLQWEEKVTDHLFRVI